MQQAAGPDFDHPSIRARSPISMLFLSLICGTAKMLISQGEAFVSKVLVSDTTVLNQIRSTLSKDLIVAPVVRQEA